MKIIPEGHKVSKRLRPNIKMLETEHMLKEIGFHKNLFGFKDPNPIQVCSIKTRKPAFERSRQVLRDPRVRGKNQSRL